MEKIFYWRNKEKKRGIIDVIYTSLTTNQLAEAKTTKTFLILDGRKYPYRCFDLTVYQKLSKFIEELGGVSILPAIFINGYYIGSYENLQETFRKNPKFFRNIFVKDKKMLK